MQRDERLELSGAVRPGISGTVARLWRPAVVYLVSRVVALIAVAWGVWFRGGSSVQRALAEWDGSWYLSVTVQGYPSAPPELYGLAVANNLAFFPLYPLTIRGLSRLTGLSALSSGVVIALVFGLVATLLLWVLVGRLCDEQVAHRSVLLFCFFPSSVFLSMVYAESLMLTLTMLCLLALLRRRWLGAGVAGALATASRPNAVALCACCLWEAVRAIRRDREWKAVIAPLLVPVGFVGFMIFLWARTGEITAWFRVEREAWGERFDLGIQTFKEIWMTARDPLGVPPEMALQVLGLTFTLAAGYLLWRWRPPFVLAIYTAAILFLCLTSSILGARPRFVLTAFPLIVAVARALDGRWFAAVLSVSVVAMIGLAVIYTTPMLAVP
ncbi:MAG: mannosyltransferase family protein [Egibacteraceae bacterium]